MSWVDTPEWQRYVKRMQAAIPEMQSSAIFLLTEDGHSASDIQRCTELGYMLITGKPLIVLVSPGQHPPAGLLRAAEIVLHDFVATAPESKARLAAALRDMRARIHQTM